MMNLYLNSFEIYTAMQKYLNNFPIILFFLHLTQDKELR